MSTDTIRTPFPTSELITERCARRAAAHPRAAAVPAHAVMSARPVNPATVAPRPTPAPTTAGAARILRRWSVAELIARAAVGGEPVVA